MTTPTVRVCVCVFVQCGVCMHKDGVRRAPLVYIGIVRRRIQLVRASARAMFAHIASPSKYKTATGRALRLHPILRVGCRKCCLCTCAHLVRARARVYAKFELNTQSTTYKLHKSSLRFVKIKTTKNVTFRILHSRGSIKWHALILATVAAAAAAV